MAEPIKRRANGTYAPGTAGGPGRPSRVTEREYMAVVASACTPERWQKIVEKAVTAAEGGDAEARKWLSKYLLGNKGIAAANPSRLDELDELW